LAFTLKAMPRSASINFDPAKSKRNGGTVNSSFSVNLYNRFSYAVS
jgi:hypothetical protein